MNIENFPVSITDLLGNMTEGLVVQEKSGAIVFHNQAALDILGLTSDQITGKTSMDPSWKAIKEDGSNFPGEEHPAMIALTQSKKVKNTIMGIETPLGDPRWVLINACPLFEDNSKEASKVFATFRNITDEQLLKKELKEQNNRMQIAMQALKFGIWDWDLVNDNLIWDDHMYVIFGIKKEDFGGAYDAFDKLLVEGESERVKKSLDGTFKAQGDFNSEFKIKRPDGQIRLIRAIAKAYYNKDGVIQRLVGTNRDITEERENEIKFYQASKMNTLGEMAAGIAHEINNPMAIIEGYLSVIENELQNVGNVNLIEKLRPMKKSVQRVTKIVKGLKTFSRQDSLSFQEDTFFKQILEDSMDLFEERLKSKGINFEYIDANMFKVNVNPVEISQIVVNLIHNSIHAIEMLDSKWIKIDVKYQKGKLFVRFIDSGSGISSENSEKLFEPFFTTKEVGFGTGLGLSISKGIAQKHGGDLVYASNEPNTTFVLTIPLT